MPDLYSELLNEANNTSIVDTHEHLNPATTFLGESPDILRDYFSHYITSDLMSAGMKGDQINMVTDGSKCVHERYAVLSPYLEMVRNTSYFRSLRIAADKLYNIPDINEKTIGDLSEKFKKLYADPDAGRYIMKKVNNIERSVNDCWMDDMAYCTTDLFVPVWHPDNYVCPDKKPSQKTLGDYLDAYTQDFTHKVQTGMVALKSSLAYNRTISYDILERSEAERLYRECTNTAEGESFKYFPKPLSDYVMHHALAEADKIGFVIQFHTGLQEGMHNNIENSNPLLLRPLFTKYPNLTFDIFHMGYPYERELIVLCKNFENVCLDMCWAHIISPYASRKAFAEMLDVLPYTKIFGFGGDYIFFDGVVGHVTLAREDICRVLAKKVEERSFDIDLAHKILRAVLRENAKRVFKI